MSSDPVPAPSTDDAPAQAETPAIVAETVAGVAALIAAEAPVMPPRPSPGEVAYNAYGEARGWTTVSGSPMPRWDDQAEAISAAWQAAAAAVAVLCTPLVAAPPVAAVAHDTARVRTLIFDALLSLRCDSNQAGVLRERMDTAIAQLTALHRELGA